MAQRWGRREPAFEQAGPYKFYPTHRRCPVCGEKLLSQEPVSFGEAGQIISLLGMPCYCMACNGKFRAVPRAWMAFLPVILTGAAGGAGMIGISLLAGYASGRSRVALVAAVLALTGAVLSMVPLLSRRIWWRLVSVKKIFEYQEGF